MRGALPSGVTAGAASLPQVLLQVHCRGMEGLAVTGGGEGPIRSIGPEMDSAAMTPVESRTGTEALASTGSRSPMDSAILATRICSRSAAV
ncbi:hypothetical protein [Corynebacterium variabile]